MATATGSIRSLIVFAVLGLLGLGAGCDGASSTSGPERLVIEGFVDISGSTANELAVDPAGRFVYLAGGMGQTGIVRVDPSVTAAMTASPFGPPEFGGGIAVDPATGRVATTDAYGANPGAPAVIGIFDRTGALVDVKPIQGCGGSFAVGSPGPLGAPFAVSTQCVDAFAIYDPAAGAIVFETATGGVSSTVHFDASTGLFYQNRTPRFGPAPRRNQPLVIRRDPGNGFVAADLGIDGFIIGIDASRRRLYFADEYGLFAPAGEIVILDSTTYAFLGTTGLTGLGRLTLSGDGRVLFNLGNGRLQLLDAVTLASIDDFDFVSASGGFTPSVYPAVSDGLRFFVAAQPQAAPGTALRLYAIGRTR